LAHFTGVDAGAPSLQSMQTAMLSQLVHTVLKAGSLLIRKIADVAESEL
jgi:hypothetical protein